MDRALYLAREQMGNTGPNPAVGCVIVKDGNIIAESATAPGGRPHAETQALSTAGDNAKNAEIYVTLEPCAHVGETPACVKEIIKSGIKKAVIAMQDPDKRTSGKSLKQLAEAGIEVELGLGGDEAHEINAGFVSRITKGRPFITVKTATSLDGKIATHTGESQWITCEKSRDDAHLLRAQNNAIMVGSGTVLFDNPMLTCRVPGLESRSPHRIVMDGRLRIDLTSQLIQTARDIPTTIFTLQGTDKHRRTAMEDLGVNIVTIPADKDGVLDINAVMQHLGKQGVNNVLVEGGANLVASLARHNLIDQLVWYRAPVIIGGDGISAIKAFGVDKLPQSLEFNHISTTKIGQDVKDIYRPAGD